jgi:hypothetical protein
MTHLHWLYTKGAKALEGVTVAIALCSKTELRVGDVTTDKSDATCPRCLSLSKEDVT